MEYQLYPLGDTAVIIEFGQAIDVETHRLVKALIRFLEQEPFPGMVEFVPAFTTVTLFYDPIVFAPSRGRKDQQPLTPYQGICQVIEQFMPRLEVNIEEATRMVEIPVCYGGEYGPDLAFVAEHNHLTPEEVIQVHTNGDYQVFMIGFAPGFPYIGGMAEKIATPRRPSPRLAIPKGSVGIAGAQTGVYPIETPGGWQLIGRTPLALFRPTDTSPSLLQAGDQIRFYAISEREYAAMKEGEV